MPINTERKNLNLNRGSINQNVSKWIEQDIIVPDTKPDAVKIVNITACPYVTGMEIMDGKIKVVGKLNYFVIYRVNDDRFINRGLFMSYPYTEILEVNGVDKDMDVSIMPCARNVIYSLPNERKISIKSEIIFKVRVRKNVNVSLINKFDTDCKIECKMCEGHFNNIVQSKKEVIMSKEDIMLPKEAEDFFEILKVDTSIINTEYKESYNKIMVKGDIEIKLVYLAENDEDNIKKITTTIPFSTMVELENINDNSKFSLNFIIQDFNIKLNEEITSTKTMAADFQIEVEVSMFEEERIEFVEDFYSQTRNLSYNNKNMDVVTKDFDLTKKIDIKENLTNIIPQNMRLIDYSLDVSNLNTTVDNKNVNIEGNAKVLLMLKNNDTSELETKSIELLVNQNFDLDILDDNSKVYFNIQDSELYITQSGTDLEIRVTLVVNTKIENVSIINIIDNIMDEDFDLSSIDSINIYIVRPGDTLWNIAKRYKTSVEKIVITNNIENPDMINVGQKILIIR